MSQKRLGFTLLETLVVIVVVFALSALALSAVQSSREASRRVTCKNRLRQLGIALNAFSAGAQIFPGGVNGRGYSLHVYLLPYLEQTSIFNSLNLTIRSLDASRFYTSNSTVCNTHLNTFVCPSDSGPSGIQAVSASYLGNRGYGYNERGSINNGAFQVKRGIYLSSFTDGLANTVAMSEALTGRTDNSWYDQRRVVFSTITLLRQPKQLHQFVAECQSDSSTKVVKTLVLKNTNWVLGDFLHTNYNHILNINGRTCTNREFVQQGAWTASSLHYGGVNVLFADGHTRFQRDGVNLAVWRALGTRNGGEIISAE